MNNHRRLSRRWLTLLGIAAALVILSGCVANVPTEYPIVNNATCWTQTRTNTDIDTTCDPPETKWTDYGDVWIWRNCDSTGTVISEYTFNAADCKTFKPTLLNPGHGDIYAHIYFGQDDTGYPAISVWCVSNGQGVQVLSVREPDLALVSGQQDQNGLITFYSGEPCVASIEVYVLTTGEYQVNIGPDGEGKIAATIFSGIPPVDIHYENLDVDGTPTPVPND